MYGGERLLKTDLADINRLFRYHYTAHSVLIDYIVLKIAGIENERRENTDGKNTNGKKTRTGKEAKTQPSILKPVNQLYLQSSQ